MESSEEVTPQPQAQVWGLFTQQNMSLMGILGAREIMSDAGCGYDLSPLVSDQRS